MRANLCLERYLCVPVRSSAPSCWCLSAPPAPTGAQSYTQLSLDLSYGLFDGIGLAGWPTPHTWARTAWQRRSESRSRPDSRARPPMASTPISAAAATRAATGGARGLTGAGTRPGTCAGATTIPAGPAGWRYDHLDFYHDCLSGGLAHAHDRWRWHARQAYRIHRPRGSGVFVSIYVRDPFWRPWGPYWAYDPWGRYWDGYRDGWRDGRW